LGDERQLIAPKTPMSEAPTKSKNRSFKRLLKSNKGHMAIMTAIMVIPLFGAVGLTIDSSRGSLAQYELQSALDAASLAVASSSVDDVNFEDRIEAFIRRNYSAQGTSIPQVSITSQDGSEIVTTASV